ncbi:MAG TPA: 6-carboxytetrahydropterin synthase [Candidatus Dormibacteraeota bacterium]|nr:6-carboxytetrahydropterin synthase [Candidatus Dormibacteraeota bacterium]
MSARERREAAATLELTRADIGFAAAHFSVLDARSERLHGHNYLVSLRVSGAVRANGTLLDFGELKRALRTACAELDERTLLPARSPAVHVEESHGEVEVRCESQRYVFPQTDVRLLPIVNTTCECLAEYLLGVVRAGLGEHPVRLELRVEEAPGQGASVSE